MTDPWVEYLGRFASTLARARRTWSQSETTEIWSALATGTVGFVLYKSVYRRVGNQHVAEEILQNCLAQLSIDRTYDPTDRGAGAFRTWVTACLHHHVCAYYETLTRERERLGRRIDDGTAAQRTDDGGSAREVEIRFDVSTMLCHLAPRERDVVTRQLNGEKAREIAQALGLSEVNVRQLSFRAMRQLRKVLGKSIVGTILRQLP